MADIALRQILALTQWTSGQLSGRGVPFGIVEPLSDKELPSCYIHG